MPSTCEAIGNYSDSNSTLMFITKLQAIVLTSQHVLQLPSLRTIKLTHLANEARLEVLKY